MKRVSVRFLGDHVQEDTSGAKRLSAAVHRTGIWCLWGRSFGIEQIRNDSRHCWALESAAGGVDETFSGQNKESFFLKSLMKFWSAKNLPVFIEALRSP